MAAPDLSAEWTQFAKEFPVPPLLGSAAELRQVVAAAKASKPYIEPVGLTIQDLNVPAGSGATGKVRIYKPDGLSLPAKTIAYIHGGGWTIGDLDSEDVDCRALCTGTNSVVVSIDYRKAPENPFPTPLEDVWAGLLWIFDSIQTLGGSGDDVYLGGSSAGANMASFTFLLSCLREHEALARSRSAASSFAARQCHPKAHPPDLSFSYEDNENAPVLPVAAIHNFVGFYNPPPTSLEVSPILAKDFSGLPPTYIQVAGADPLRNDGTNYAAKLKDANVPVKVDLYPGLPHAFYGFSALESTKKCVAELLAGVQWLSEQK